MPMADSNLQYEELMDGSVPCPSCDGTGKIPKEREKQLIALIPLNDKRLKPRRTTLWVSLAVLISITVWALCMFFLIPRSIMLDSDDAAITPYHSYISHNESTIEIGFFKSVHITNYNYVTVSVINSTLVTMQVLDSPRVIGRVTNLTEVVVPLRSSSTLTFNTTITFDTPLAVKYCDMIHVMFMQFDITVTAYYLGHSEERSLSTSQRLFCDTNPQPDDM